MKVTLLPVVVLTTVALCSAASDPECKYRKSHKLPSHWAHPTECGRFYRCTNKSVKREVLCAVGQVYDTSVGKCADDAPGLCNLMLPVAEAADEDVCTGVASGTFKPRTGYCRDYYVCNANLAILQECDAGEYFDNSTNACVPDTNGTCWQNFCLDKSDGSVIPDDSNCLSYYNCSDKLATKEQCASGDYFNSADGSCQSDPSGEHCSLNLCNGVASGTSKPRTGYCRDYYVCNANLTILQECDAGEYFDNSTDACVADTNGTCWQNFCLDKSDGSVIPDDSNCLSYYNCSDKLATKEQCASGNYFNSADGCCQSDPSGEHCSLNLCNSKADGTFVKNSNDCLSYYICNRGLAVAQDCPNGSYFDAIALNCQPGNCPTTDCTPATTTPCPSVVTTTCSSGGNDEETTEANTNQFAVIMCPGGYTEGQFVAHPSNRQLFYICAKGKLVQYSCQQGNKFDENVSACVSEMKKKRAKRAKYNAVSDKEARQGLSALGLPLNSEMMTVPIVEPSDDDQWKRNLDDSAAFFVSSNGKKKQEVEPIDDSKTFYELTHFQLKPREIAAFDFDPIEEQIMPVVAAEPVIAEAEPVIAEAEPVIDEAEPKEPTAVAEPLTESDTVERDPNDVAPNCHGIYYEGQLVKHPQHCRKFLVCHDGKLKTGDCGRGNYYNATINSCTMDYYRQCTDENALISGDEDEVAPAAGETNANCTCPGGEKEGTKLPNLYYGYLYYTCLDRKWVLGNCSVGNCFNANTGACERDTDNACWPADICKGQSNGAMMKDLNNCAAFYVCKNGVGKLTNCPTGKYFKQTSSNRGYCETDVDAVCLNPCAGTTGIVFLPVFDDPVKYYMCNNGTTYVETCTVGYFDVTLGRCDPNVINEKTLCLNQEDGTTFPVVGDASKFYKCVSSVATIENCLPDTEFNEKVGVCLAVPSASCDQTQCVGTAADEYFPPITGMGNSSAFCACRGDDAFIHYCPDGYTFREDLSVCYSNAPCDPDLCTYMPENTRSENRNDTGSFCLCVMRQQVIVDCPDNATFNPATKLCQPKPVQNQNCDPTYCLTHADYTIFPALYNNIDGFCMCLNTGSEYVPCQNGNKYNEKMQLCLPVDPTSVCPPSNCQNNAGLIFAANGASSSFCYCSDNSTAVMRSCPNNEDFDKTLLICMATGCDANFCLTAPDGPFPADNDPYSFCLCTNTATVTKMACPAGDRFDIHKLVCRTDPCNKNFCVNPNNEGVPYAANNYTSGFCMCNNGYATLHDCENDYLFDAVSGVCVPSVQLECNIALCAKATVADPFPIPAVNDPHSFCYCFSAHTVDLFHCPEFTIYTDAGFCEPEFPNSDNPTNPDGPMLPPTDPTDKCICPGGYTAGQMVPVKGDCRAVAICQNGKLQKFDCGTGNFYDPYMESCQVDKMGTCISPAAYNCIGAYREGEYVVHPTNSQLYYLCYNAVLTPGDCGAGNVLDVADQMCKPLAEVGKRRLRSAVGAADAESEDNNDCMEDEKQPVAANCAQYDVCLDGKWVRRNCSHAHYYNSLQQECQKPHDDTVCAFARFSGLPTCSDNAMQQRTLPAKRHNCTQYYRCSSGQWRLQTCAPQHFYSRQWHTCLPTGHADVCHARNATQHSAVEDATQRQCRHTAVRHYAANCAMFLMCLENEWWYQYCPLGMYFSRTHNYCLPNDADQCASAAHIQAESITLANDGFAAQTCSVEGALRASALACNRYYVCASRSWHQQNCAAAHYFNITAEACVDNKEGLCENRLLTALCVENERRAFPLNCTAYEWCVGGEWQRTGCAANEAYDDVLQVCVPNDGSCSRSGLRRACQAGESRALPLAGNCTQFYYCQDDSWQVGACLLGHFYWPTAGGCVPHAAHNQCQPLWQANEAEANASTACMGQKDGEAVAHSDNCRRFFLCVAEAAFIEQECVHGSFFDAQLGYCRPNDGSCRVPLSGVCANATDESRVPNADDCRAYYRCSTMNGTQLVNCPEGEYYHNYTQQCRADNGECREQQLDSKCAGSMHGKRLPHERYCNIYYACVRGLAVPIECADDHRFSAAQGRCIYDAAHECEDGQLSGNSTNSYNCSHVTDGTHLADRIDCTRYYVCAQGVALPKRCAADAYFDAQQLLCMPDDGSCPHVDDDQPKNQTVPLDPAVCEGKHGHLLPDRANCNEFYVCVNGKLRHERCYENHYFNATMAQCQLREQQTANLAAAPLSQCADKPTDFEDLCAQIPEGSSIAEQGDCRHYINCEDNGPTTQRCRNGESYDSLLGICRQNDGTCLMENGRRVGDCNGRHGQLARVADNCRGYFVCINGQKIKSECAADEYFSKSLNMCQPDVKSQCSATTEKPDEPQTLTCNGLGEEVLYPHVHDNCRSYFQCVKGVAKVHQCADGLYFNATLMRCVREIHECAMPVANLKRAPEIVHAKEGICNNAKIGKRYANVDDHCRSYYVCESDGSLSFTTCGDNMLFNTDSDNYPCWVVDFKLVLVYLFFSSLVLYYGLV